ncbi:MAG: sulfur carrier protein ThiS [Limnobacter sp.]|nr:sulfur carrier protein ThiS [Limnobacter sp.]
MTVTVNGQAHQIEQGALVSDLLTQLNLTGKRIAVELNGEIIPKSEHSSTALEPNSELEIVVAVGGG